MSYLGHIGTSSSGDHMDRHSSVASRRDFLQDHGLLQVDLFPTIDGFRLFLFLGSSDFMPLVLS